MSETLLEFQVEHQHIKRVDKTYVVAKSQNYVYASFEFLTDEWGDFTKTAVFTTKDSNEEETSYSVILLEDNKCLVPWEVLDKVGYVYVSVFGGSLITVDKAIVFVSSTGYKDETETTKDPTGQVYAQLIGYFDEVKETVLQGAEDAEQSALQAAQAVEDVQEYAEMAKHYASNVDGGTFEDWQEEGE